MSIAVPTTRRVASSTWLSLAGKSYQTAIHSPDSAATIPAGTTTRPMRRCHGFRRTLVENCSAPNRQKIEAPKMWRTTGSGVDTNRSFAAVAGAPLAS